MGKIIITNETKKFIEQNKKVIGEAIGEMAKDIVTVAKIRVPFKEGDLQKSLSAEKIDTLKYFVIADKEYAAYQEAGERADGSHVVRKYTTPGTGKKFLEGAGEQVTKQAMNYFKQAVNRIRL